MKGWVDLGVGYYKFITERFTCPPIIVVVSSSNHLIVTRPGGSRTHNLFIASPLPYTTTKPGLRLISRLK